MSKSTQGNFFEDFQLRQRFIHAPARTLTVGDATLYKTIYGARFALQSSEPLAKAVGFETIPFDDLLVFHMVFGMSVGDISPTRSFVSASDCIPARRCGLSPRSSA
jgi:2-methylfumaryl-CoA hydratase